ncbi:MULTISPECIES: hypothetical protein [Streptomyces]|uniref:hypothetical protein n=1 Tax=Streptomyces TaxID=1883 RepID=UPI0019B4315A|nr:MULTISPECIES: hypothetical protein [Streptomyces]UFR01929.1 hypothetical protein KBP30_12365 [Streptomyces sp. Go40/10]GGS87848.1 hypothetical protein GCM10010206_58180 [Streptomyces cinerochromogenes]
MSGGGGSGMRRGIDALAKFKTAVDKALTAFEGAPGSPSRLAEHKLSASSFSGSNIPFHEATELHGKYEQVHERLTTLSQNLGMQIEALTLAAHAADVTYDSTEDEVRRRFWQIRSHLAEQHHEATQSKGEHADHKPAKAAEHGGDDKSAGAGSID